MNKYRKSFAIISILFLVVLAIAPFKDYFREWKWYQYQFNDLIKTLPVRVNPADVGIKQIWVQKLDRVDRCVTCHLGIKNDALKTAKQPFRTHPRMHHDVEEFGCTICHGGQGAATEYKAAIGNVEFWDKPILPAKYMESSCGKCHKGQVVPEAPVLSLGRKLINEYNCAGCHKIDGFEKQWVPSLDGIGSKVNRGWLVNWLTNPKAYASHSHMPNFQLSADDVNMLADFLMADTVFSDVATLDSLPKELTGPADDKRAKLTELGSTRFREARCISCHPINGKGGYVAIDLGKVASKVTPAWLYNYIKNPKHLQPDVMMPRFRFSPDELAGVVSYMQGDFVDYDMQQPPSHTPDPDFYQKGLALFKKNNCAGCHRLGSANKAEDLAPDLSAIGSKHLYEIEFGTSKIEQSVPSYVAAKVTNPRQFSAALKMPNFGFSEEEATAITVALLANTDENIPEQMLVRAKPKSTFAPQGEFGKLVNDLACLGCHVMQGKGRLVATDLSLEASQAQPQWIENYFTVPYSLRPILTERMPKLFMTDAERKTVVQYMQSSFIADSISRDVKSDPDLISKGKGLYFEAYACNSCHQIESKGGYVGPPLDHLANRLTPGWIFHWLKNPQAYRPETIEPNNKLSDGDASALTAFLMTLK